MPALKYRVTRTDDEDRKGEGLLRKGKSELGAVLSGADTLVEIEVWANERVKSFAVIGDISCGTSLGVIG
jgi:hypothetical protein